MTTSNDFDPDEFPDDASATRNQLETGCCDFDPDEFPDDASAAASTFQRRVPGWYAQVRTFRSILETFADSAAAVAPIGMRDEWGRAVAALRDGEADCLPPAYFFAPALLPEAADFVIDQAAAAAARYVLAVRAGRLNDAAYMRRSALRRLFAFIDPDAADGWKAEEVADAAASADAQHATFERHR